MLNAPQTDVLVCIRTHPGLNVPRISDMTRISPKSVECHVKMLTERGLIKHRGSKKTGGYYAK